ncbi:MAG TPA: hypothetical protein VMC09_10195 [Anaerolineales bacterium]|nr:hypothetical protein [Anaerolineales bacterium]
MTHAYTIGDSLSSATKQDLELTWLYIQSNPAKLRHDNGNPARR